MNVCLANWANIATIVLAGAAIIAGIYAALNLRVLKKRHRHDVLVNLIGQIADRTERANRSIINKRFKEDTSAQELKMWVDVGRKADLSHSESMSVVNEDGKEIYSNMKRADIINIKNAIEETIACFDTAGFFLLGGDNKLKNEAPDWIWTMTHGMWKRLGAYVLYRQESGEPNWGKYFRQLDEDAKKRLTNERE